MFFALLSILCFLRIESKGWLSSATAYFLSMFLFALALLKEHGMDSKDVDIPKESIRTVIREYTREAGVRSLERWIATLCRKTAKS